MSINEDIHSDDDGGSALQERLRRTFEVDQAYAQLEARWPEYLAGRTSHFTEEDWALIKVEKELQAEAHARRVRRQAVNFAVAVLVLVGAIACAVWAIPAALAY